MPEMQKKSGVTRLVSEISYVVDRAKLPYLVIVAVVLSPSQEDAWCPIKITRSLN